MSNNISDLSDTIKPKSDQLNADDLMASDKTIKISGVKRGGADDPVVINYEGDDGRPYKPCKSMRRVIISLWGENGNDWIGRSMTLYCDPTVKWAGKEVGGIRISHMSHLKGNASLMLTTTRGRRSEYKVKLLKAEQKKPYPESKFNDALPKIKEMIQNGEKTPEQLIAHCEKTGPLTKEQRDKIRSFAEKEQSKPEPQKTESEYLAETGESKAQTADDGEVDYNDLFED
jgi:hypothetical protein